jgi:hypothetical protein
MQAWQRRPASRGPSMTPFVTAGAGFLLAVLWFDLMFDVQVLRRRAGDVAEPVLASIAAYYRRVTTDARPMSFLVALAMLATILAIVVQIAAGSAPRWAAWTSLVLITAAVLLAGLRTVPSAQRLGARHDPIDVQSRLARTVGRDHLVCATLIVLLLLVQLGFAPM